MPDDGQRVGEALEDEGFGNGSLPRSLEFLISDNAHDVFTKTFNFVQDSTFPEAAGRTYKKSESSGGVMGYPADHR